MARAAEKLANVLTDQEKYWITRYTDANWQRGFAQALRGRAPMTPDYVEARRVISGALEKLPLEKRALVWRGMKELPPTLRYDERGLEGALRTLNRDYVAGATEAEKQLATDLWQGLVGSSFDDKAFMSTSYQRNATRRYGDCLFAFHLDPGLRAADINSISLMKNVDYEMLLDCGYNVTIETVKIIQVGNRLQAIFVGRVHR